MAKDRARDDRRSVGSHEKMVAALGRATGSVRAPAGALITKLKTRKGDVNVDFPGKGHVNVGKKFTEHASGETKVPSRLYTEAEGRGVHGTAGISGEHKNPKGAPSNIFKGMD